MSSPIEGWELSAYIDGDLPPERMAQVEAAARRSPELRRRLEEMLADHRALRLLDTAERLADGDLLPGLARQAATLSERLGIAADPAGAGAAEPMGTKRPAANPTAPDGGGWRRGIAGSWRQATVLAAGTAVGWAAASWAAPPADVLSAFIDEAAEIHRVAVMAPGFSQEASGPVLDGLRMLFAHKITPPDLAGAGFALSRIDVAATDTGPAAVLYYTDPEARRVSLVLSLDSPILDALGHGAPGHAVAAPRVTTHDGFAVSFGEGDGVAYALVGSIPEPRARQLASRVAETLMR